VNVYTMSAVGYVTFLAGYLLMIASLKRTSALLCMFIIID